MSEKDKKNIPEVRFDGFNEEWEKKKLGDDAKLFAGGTPSTTNPEYWNGNINWLCSGAVQNNVISEDDVEQKITEKGLQESSAKMIKPDSVLIAMTGATCGNVGYLPFETSGNQSVMAVEPNSDDAKFLYYNLLKNRDAILKHKAGGAQAGVNKSSCKNIEIMNASLEEQKKIAEFFKQLDKLIELNERKVEKLETMKKSLLEKMFPVGGATTPKIRFEGFSEEWKKKTLGEITEKFEYGMNAPAKEFDGIHKYLRITDIDDVTRTFQTKNLTSPEYFKNDISSFKLTEQDIVFARTGASVGKTYLYDKNDGNVFFAGFLIRAIISPEHNPAFVFYNTLTKKFEKFVKLTSQRSGQPGINSVEYASFDIYIPQKKEQFLIAKTLQYISRNIINIKNKIEKLRNLKISFLNKMIPHTHTHTQQ